MTTEKATTPGMALDNEALARAASPICTDLYGDRYMQGSWSRVDLDKEQDAFVGGFTPEVAEALIAQARAAQPQPSAAPDGWQWAPIEPTEAMVHAGEDVPAPRPFGKVYRAMLAAAPSPNFAARGAEPAGMQAAGAVEDWKTRMVKNGQTEDIAIRAENRDLRAQLSAACQGQALGYVEDYDLTRFQSEGKQGDYLRLYARPSNRAKLPLYAAPQPTAAPTPHEQEARAAVPAVIGKPPLPPADQHTEIGARLFLVSTLCNYGTACFQAGEQHAQAEMLPVAQTDAARDVLEPVDGDLLPPVGSKVLIHLARQDAWIEHTVAGYYVWPALRHQVQDGEKDAHRVFVRVMDARGYDNARLLSEVRIAAKGAAGLEGGAGGAS